MNAGQDARELVDGGDYKYGFVTDIESDIAPPGLSEDTIRLLSGFITGLTGFVAYFFAFASLVEARGPAIALFAGVAASLLAVSLALAWQIVRRRLMQ